MARRVLRVGTMRALRFVCAVVLAHAVVLTACSGAQKSDLIDASASPPATPEVDSGAVAPDPGADSGSSTPPTDASAPATDADTPSEDAGPVVILDAGPDHEGGIACVAGGTLEIEPNDTAATATTLNGTVCGEISPGTASDFLKFTLKVATTSFKVTYKGNITITFRVDGQTVTWANGSFPPVPFVRGMEYSLELKAADSKYQPYRVTLTET